MRVRRALRDVAVCGLDLSLRGAAIAVIPVGWDMKLSSVLTLRCGESLPRTATELDQVQRMWDVGRAISDFAWQHDAIRHSFVEAYAFSRRSDHAHRLAELGGITKLMWFTSLFSHGFEGRCVPTSIVASQARKTVLGKLPKKDVKDHVVARLREWGAPQGWTEDECDAFVIANEGRFRVGLAGLGVPAER